MSLFNYDFQISIKINNQVIKCKINSIATRGNSALRKSTEANGLLPHKHHIESLFGSFDERENIQVKLKRFNGALSLMKNFHKARMKKTKENTGKRDLAQNNIKFVEENTRKIIQLLVLLVMIGKLEKKIL